MEKLCLITILALLSMSSYSQKEENVKEIITQNMHEQELAWNKGDLEGFMSAYSKSDSLKFIGKNGITYGWQNILDNYKKSYPDKAAMGTLDFIITSIDQPCAGAAIVIGKWHLKKEKGDVSGYFTLVWRRTETRWVITMDHTS